MELTEERKILDAALNVALAEETFSKLPPSTQKEVIDRARDILRERTSSRFSDYLFSEGPSSIEAHGFYALAMSELGIEPAIEAFPKWKSVADPFIVEQRYKIIDQARNTIKAKSRKA